MSFKKTIVIGCCLLLAACNTFKNPNADKDVNVMDADAAGAKTSQVDVNDQFGEDSLKASSSDAQGLLTKRTYYFDFDKSDIHDADKNAIIANADYLVAHPNAHIIVEGHTDPRGSREYNVALGERRANSVAVMLKEHGVLAAQIRVVSYGAEQLAASGHSEEDFQLDRRAIIVYVQK